ncbi:hypothetical protein TNCV_2965301 [Trichonephila clavipes]|nr:hypothetical protein TNCV_2965301 [Trichonephila clavipes]
MVWAGFSTDGRSDRHIIRFGSLTAQRYLEYVIYTKGVTYAPALWKESQGLQRAQSLTDAKYAFGPKT